MKGDLISVVISTHGRSDRIEKAIKSVLAQTYKNFEIIVVDDNSDCYEERQKTIEIIKKYPQVRLIKNSKNLGGGLTRNVGVKNTSGGLISFLDDDDQYVPDRLEKLYKLYRKHVGENVGLVYCSCSAINEKGKVVQEFIRKYDGKPFYEHMLNCIAGTSMWLVPKKALEDIGGFDDVPSKQDSTVILKMLVAGYSVFGTSEKLVLYFEHGGNGVSGTKPSNAEGIRLYREKCRKQYNRLTKREIANVECNFSKDLITNYVVNGELTLARFELKNIGKYKPFSKIYCKNAMKILFRKRYLGRLRTLRGKKENG